MTSNVDKVINEVATGSQNDQQANECGKTETDNDYESDNDIINEIEKMDDDFQENSSSDASTVKEPNAPTDKYVHNINQTNINNQTQINKSNEEECDFILVGAKGKRIEHKQVPKIFRRQLITKNRTYLSGEGIEKYVGKHEAILKEMRRCKPNVYVQRVSITKENLLLIVTNDEKSTNEIRNLNWPANAFQEGVKVANLNEMHYISIKGVRKNLRIDEEERKRLYNDYGIVNTTRVFGIDRKPTYTLKARLESEDDFLNAIEDGIYIYDFLHQATPWENRLTVCTNCQEIGHTTSINVQDAV